MLGFDPVGAAVADLLRNVAAGVPVDGCERELVDAKEEPGRRGPGGVVLPGANRPLPDGTVVIGTDLHPERLRHRIYELTGQRLTPNVLETTVAGTRVLVLAVPPAVEPIRWDDRIKWRVGANCVEIDAATWHEQRLTRMGHDVTAAASGRTATDVRPLALDLARRFLQDRVGDPAAADLAAASDRELLERLGLLVGDTDELNVAGSLLFVDTGFEALDYVRRAVDGDDSVARVRRAGPLIEQLWDVFTTFEAHNPVAHLPDGLAAGQLRHIPVRAAREAIVNGVAHRDWSSLYPTSVEHVGDRLVVTSPGGLVPGITVANILTHPSRPRHRALAHALSRLRIAELEGIGVDRMFVDLITMGHAGPHFAEIDGPAVRTVLLGGPPDAGWVDVLRRLEPVREQRNVATLLLLRRAVDAGWFDAPTAAPLLQRTVVEADAATLTAASVLLDGRPLFTTVVGTPPDTPTAWRLSDTARDRLRGRLPYLTVPAARRAVALGWVRERGRGSSTEIADLVDVSSPTANQVLRGLAHDGLITGNRETMRGRGAAYVPVG